MAVVGRTSAALRHAAKPSVSWIDVVPFGWLGASGLGPELVAKPVFSVAPKPSKSVVSWQRSGSKVVTGSWAFHLWGCPARAGFRSASLMFRFIHRIEYGVFKRGAPADFGARQQRSWP